MSDNVDIQELLRECKEILPEPEITEQEYRQKVREMADEVIQEFEDVSLENRVFKTADESELAFDTPGTPINYHQNEPYRAKDWIRRAPNVYKGLALSCLITDLREEVYERKAVPLEELLDEIFDEYDHIAEVYISHPGSNYSKLNTMYIRIHTSEADWFEDRVSLVPQSYLKIETKDDTIVNQFKTIATYDGPGGLVGKSGTVLYEDENVSGSTPRGLDEGLTILRRKLSGICPICQEEVKFDGLSDHFEESRSCRRKEELSVTEHFTSTKEGLEADAEVGSEVPEEGGDDQ